MLNAEFRGAVLLKNVILLCINADLHKQTVDIYLKEGKIARIAPSGSFSAPDAFLFDGAGAYVSVGWMDAGAELCFPADESREDLNSFTRAARNGGFSEVVAYPVGAPLPANGAGFDGLAAAFATYPLQMRFAAPFTTDGNAMTEMGELSARGAVAFFSPFDAVGDSANLLNVLTYARSLEVPCVQTPIENAFFNDGMANESLSTVGLGLKTQPTLAEVLAIKRLLSLNEYAQGELIILPVTAAESLNIMAQKSDTLAKVWCLTAPPYLSFTDECLVDFDPNFKFKPPLRTEADRTALISALIDGTLTAVASLHAPRTTEEKDDLDFIEAAAGAMGLETAAPAVYEALSEQIADKDNLLEIFVRLFTENPRKIYGISIPKLIENAPANLTIFSTTHSFTYSTKQSAAKCVNTPYNERTFQLRVEGVITGERFYYRNSE